MSSVDAVSRFHAALEHEPRVNLHRHAIQAELDGDVLIVEGEVEDIAAKKICMTLAATTTGATGIVDRVRIARETKMTDAEIRDHLRNSLLQEPAFRDCSMQVESDGHREVARRARAEPYAFIHAAVADGVITLNGRVPSLSHQRLAGVLAWWIPGTRDVINGLEVSPDQADNDDEITDAIRMVLEKDRFVDASGIRVRTADRAVRLEGIVPNERIREIAERDAWFVLGVSRVDNQLQVAA